MGSTDSLKQGSFSHGLVLYKSEEAGLSYRKIIKDVKKNIINIMIIPIHANYIKKSVGYHYII